MQTNILLSLLMTLLFSGGAYAQAPASLELFHRGHMVAVYSGQLKTASQVSPLFCPMVRNKLGHYMKTARKLSHLADKIKSGTSSATDRQEFEALKTRQLEDGAFLAAPAPQVSVTWALGDIVSTMALANALRSRQFEFDLESWIINTSNEFGYELPEQVKIQINPEGSQLTLSFSPKTADFCLSEPYARLQLNIIAAPH